MEFTDFSGDVLALETDCLIIPVADKSKTLVPISGLDALSEFLATADENHLVDKRHGKLTFMLAPETCKARWLLLVGCGDKPLTAAKYRALCDIVAPTLKVRKVRSAAHLLCALAVEDRNDSWKARQAILGMGYGDYRYTSTRSTKPSKAKIEKILLPHVSTNDAHQAKAMAKGVATARELGNLPPNLLNPATLAARATEIAESYDTASIDILDVEAMEELGMGALLAVGKGSGVPPRLIVLHHNGGKKGAAPVALVGKGITFDTGGISLKPGAAMDEMKFDMCGAAGVIGAFVACCEMKLPLNVVTIVPAVENMPDGHAYRPGDVVTTMSGKTVEVLNTDAEGRLILCDALTYAQKFEPRLMVDAATLTGACVVALGRHASAVMSKDDELAQMLIDAGDESFDRIWRLPLWDEYQNQLDSNFADFSNLGGSPAGAITAGCFLARFCEDVRWAHLDVAGSAWLQGAKKGATGRPAAVLAQFLINQSNEP